VLLLLLIVCVSEAGEQEHSLGEEEGISTAAFARRLDAVFVRGQAGCGVRGQPARGCSTVGAAQLMTSDRRYVV
jgi:hypothetical protein